MGKSCQKYAKLVSESLDRPLNLVEKIKLRIHLWMCAYCSGFLRNAQKLRSFLQEDQEVSPPLPPQKQQELKKLVQKNIEEGTDSNPPPDE